MTLFLGLATTACGDGDDDAAPSRMSQPSSAPADLGDDAEIIEENDLVYLTDDEGTWTLDVAYPAENGPWPLIVVVPHRYPAPESLRTSLSVALSWCRAMLGQRPAAWTTDPNRHLYGEMNRAACIVSWAQAHAGDYGADPQITTVAGYSGGAPAATWVGLGLADDGGCDEPIAALPVAVVPGESQFLFLHERWDAAFVSGDPEPRETVDGLLNRQRWNVSPECCHPSCR